MRGLLGNSLQDCRVVRVGRRVHGYASAVGQRSDRDDDGKHRFQHPAPLNAHIDSQVVAARRFDPANRCCVVFWAGAFQHRWRLGIPPRAHCHSQFRAFSRVLSNQNSLQASCQFEVRQDDTLSLCAAYMFQSGTFTSARAHHRHDRAFASADSCARRVARRTEQRTEQQQATSFSFPPGDFRIRSAWLEGSLPQWREWPFGDVGLYTHCGPYPSRARCAPPWPASGYAGRPVPLAGLFHHNRGRCDEK
jgi:hypothetical protein